MIKKENGVTLIALSIAVIIILTITGMIIYSARDNIYIRNLTNMQNDIANLRDKVADYYAEYGDIPAKTEYPDIGNLQSAGIIGANDTGKFLIIELEYLSGLTLNYGEDYEKYKDGNYTNLTDLTDIYIINETSHNIFYVEGIRVRENDTTKMYYTDYTEGDNETIDLKEIQNWHEETNEAGETIVTNGIAQFKIGDYVDYNPQDGANTMSYTSLTTKTGHTDDQVFNLASYQYGWRVLGVDENTNEILLVAEDPIGPDSGGKEENGRTYYYLSGRAGYVNGQSELDTISKLYGQGKGASGARSIMVEDVNNITGYEPSIGGTNTNSYGNEVTYINNGNFIEYSGSNNVSGTSTYKVFEYYDGSIWKILSAEGDNNSVTLTSSYYDYIGSMYLDTNTLAYNMLFAETSSAYYWLASQLTLTNGGYAYFGLRGVWDGKVNYCNLFHSYSQNQVYENGVRPVVSLNANISILQQEGTSENPHEIQ